MSSRKTSKMLEIETCRDSTGFVLVPLPRRITGHTWRVAVVFACALGVMVATVLQEHHLVRTFSVAPNDRTLLAPRHFPANPSSLFENEPLATISENDDATFSIVVQLSGEMGNHLSKLASGIGLSLWLRQLYPDRPTEIRVRHQENTNKWIPVMDNLHSCVPYLANLNASEAQHEPFPWSPQQNGVGINSDGHTKIVGELLSHGGSSKNATTLFSNHLSIMDPYMDRYYSNFREYFAWNTTNDACCKSRPYPDETVIHIRNFLVELPRIGQQLGFEELSPHDLVNQAMASIPAPGRVALISRFPDHMQDYVEALANANYTVRVMRDQTSAQDFCFLMQAQYAMIGTARSTFFWWAAVLSNATNVHAYAVDSPATRAFAQRSHFSLDDPFQFTHPDIVQRFRFPLYEATTKHTTEESGRSETGGTNETKATE